MQFSLQDKLICWGRGKGTIPRTKSQIYSDLSPVNEQNQELIMTSKCCWVGDVFSRCGEKWHGDTWDAVYSNIPPFLVIRFQKKYCQQTENKAIVFSKSHNNRSLATYPSKNMAEQSFRVYWAWIPFSFCFHRTNEPCFDSRWCCIAWNTVALTKILG